MIFLYFKPEAKGKRVAHDRIYFGPGAMRKTVGFTHKPEAKR